jgi:dTDP-4-amino-4,6-dideoxygalactose transaminase
VTETPRVPSTRLDNAEVWDAVLPKLKELVLSGRFILGPELEEFETLTSQTVGAQWCVGTSSGTSALQLALRASGLKSGSRVALPANTFFATFEAVLAAGHVPVLVDHDEHYLINLDQLETLEDVGGVIPVHLYGLPVDMTRLMRLAEERDWFVLEDASQAHGATVDRQPVGSFGHAAAFSCYPTKNLGAWGDAGFVCGHDPTMETRIRALRHHGQTAPNLHNEVSGTERLDNLQALVLTEKLQRLDGEVNRRREVASAYSAGLRGVVKTPGDHDNRLHAFHQFVIEVPRREEIRRTLKSRGISTNIHYPTPVHLQPAARGRFVQGGPLLRSEESCHRILSLPIFPRMREDEVVRVVTALRHALGN